MASEVSRPLLLARNRRLRHLQGISLRNLSLPLHRGYTIDDAELNKSPQKLEALRQPEMYHSQSSDNLNSKIRPGKTRRRSTNWAGQSASYRQKKLEDVIEGGMADSFFSLHCEDLEEPIFVSEVVEKSMNPSFRFFDLTSYGPSIRRRSTITIKIWVKRQGYSLLLEQKLDFSSLHFIGTLENRPLPLNCIIFHLIDGIYTLDTRSDCSAPKPSFALSTSSYGALMRLSRLDDSIQDALATRESIAAQINVLLEDNPVNEVSQSQEAAALASRYLTIQRRLMKQSLQHRNELKASILSRRQAIEQGNEAQSHATEDIKSATEKLEKSKIAVQTIMGDIYGQRRRICEELLEIFPIEPTSQTLLFTISGLALPNSLFDDSDEDVVSAALGHVARLVDMLQYYLFVPLPYPITAFGSRSVVRDQISMLADSQRTFPLFSKGTIRYRFDYGVFLLNKNIECLAESQGLKVIDIRHTLPNLKYLLYVCSAGNSDLPARKAGGIRGLLSDKNTPLPSRRGSEDAPVNIARLAPGNGSFGHGSGNGNGNGNMRTRVKSPGGTRRPVSMDESTSLRTRGLRENFVH